MSLSVFLPWLVGCEGNLYENYELEGKFRSESGILFIGERGKYKDLGGVMRSDRKLFASNALLKKAE